MPQQNVSNTNADVDLESAMSQKSPGTKGFYRSSGSDDGHYMTLGNDLVDCEDVCEVFEGDFRPCIYTRPVRKFANPAPMGLLAYGITAFVLSLCNVHARHVTTPNIVVGMAYAYGGLVQLLAGMWEVAVENTFGATALASYAGFWISYAIIQTNGFDIASSYTKASDLRSALGFYLMGWFIFTFLLMLCTIRSTLALFGLFFASDLMFLLLACAELTGKVGVQKGAGWIGFLTGALAFYNAFAGLATPENSYMNMSKMMLRMPGSKTSFASKTKPVSKTT